MAVIFEEPSRIEDNLCLLAETVNVCALRILLDTGRVRATVPMLRGVWGAALKDLAPSVYKTVFEGCCPNDTLRSKLPLYVMRPAPADPDTAPAVELLLFADACNHVSVALKAFELAAARGLGAQRECFEIKSVLGLSPDSGRLAIPQIWSAREAVEALSRDVGHNDAVRIKLLGPMRILRRGQLVHVPSFTDLAVAGLRRLLALSGDVGPSDLQAMLLNAARCIPTTIWEGSRQDLVRWSARQQTEITLHAVAGEIDLPEGLGPFRPLFAACQWFHMGKGTVFGLGQPKLWRL